MSRWSLPLGIGLAIALVAVAAFGALGAARTAAERADSLAAELRCPDCQGLSVADSPTRSAQEMRRQIDALIADGATDGEIRAHFTARYGEWIRLAPSATWPWLLPFAVVVIGAAGLVAWLRRRGTPTRAAVSSATLSHDERRRLHAEAEALDG